MNSYLTIKNYAFYEITQKRSRFFAEAFNVESEHEVVKTLESTRKKHFASKHNPYAYILKKENIERFSDDKEPQGTAGAQILKVLKKFKLCDAMIIVSRYFGGTLLGKGNLARAYWHAANFTIDEKNITEVNLYVNVLIKCKYEILYKIKKLIIDFDGYIKYIDYQENAKISAALPKNHFEDLSLNILSIDNLEVKIQFLNEEYLKPK